MNKTGSLKSEERELVEGLFREMQSACELDIHLPGVLARHQGEPWGLDLMLERRCRRIWIN